MTDELKIFGKTMGSGYDENFLSATAGIFRFTIRKNQPIGVGTVTVGFISLIDTESPIPMVSEWGETAGDVRDKLESEARRIMRECLEIATGPVLVGATQPPTDNCVVVTTDEQYRELYRKPMPSMWTCDGKKTITLPFADTDECEDPDD